MENIKISNFRKVEGEWDLNLNPITFLVGPNNSGKSSILKYLMILSDHLSSGNLFQLKFDGPLQQKHKIIDYRNAINWHVKSEELRFSYSNLGFDILLLFKKSQLEQLKVKRLSDSAFLDIKNDIEFYSIKFDNRLLIAPEDGNDNFRSAVLELELEIHSVDDKIEALFLDFKELINNHLPSRLIMSVIGVNYKEDDYKTTAFKALSNLDKLRELVKHYHTVKSLVNLLSNLDSKIQEKNLLTGKINTLKKLIKSEEKSYKKELGSHNVYMPTFNKKEIEITKNNLFNILQKQLIKYIDESQDKIGKVNIKTKSEQLSSFITDLENVLTYDLSHLSPIRNSQSRVFLNKNSDYDINKLLVDYQNNPVLDLEGTEERDFVITWLKKFDIGEDFKIINISNTASQVQVKEKGHWVDLADKGFGAGQIFTIILQIALLSLNSTSNKLMLIEEPEANLHPKFQSQLTEMFLAAYQSFKVRFVVETHSEYIVRRSQLLALENDYLSNQELNPNPFSIFYFHKEDGPYQMEYNSQGKFNRDFGPGFYDEAGSLTLKMIKELRKNKAQ
ncbi:AAA family ATPase [Gaetbulibacter sp. PBL-D1]|uniref:AAA family ATPase n=1 Tax=Gaetbulibacter sp. PBL-D1 TaxID=3422594 RepID=UPI003D2EA478